MAELDYLTIGNRGIGRLTTNIPRFAAHYRKTISNMNIEKRKELANHLYQLVYIGYLTKILWYEKEVCDDVEIKEDEELFALWIPGIYSTNLQKLSELVELLIDLGENTIIKICTLLDEFNEDTMDACNDETLDLILTYYLISGFGLREREILNIDL